MMKKLKQYIASESKNRKGFTGSIFGIILFLAIVLFPNFSYAYFLDPSNVFRPYMATSSLFSNSYTDNFGYSGVLSNGFITFGRPESCSLLSSCGTNVIQRAKRGYNNAIYADIVLYKSSLSSLPIHPTDPSVYPQYLSIGTPLSFDSTSYSTNGVSHTFTAIVIDHTVSCYPSKTFSECIALSSGSNHNSVNGIIETEGRLVSTIYRPTIFGQNASLGDLYTNSSISDLMKSMLLLIIGAGLGILQALMPYIIGLVVISAIVYFLYRAFRLLN